MAKNKRLAKALIRQDFASFINRSFKEINPGQKFVSNWHINLIAEYLEAARLGQKKRIIINMPPRALKSVCVSVAWPAWLLAKDPTCRIMCASYSQVLSIKHSLDCRHIIESNWYKELFPSTKLSKSNNQKSKFITSKHGFRFATSVGGSATGEGGDVLIIDDPHNPTRINYPKIRKSAHDWFDQTFASRLNNQKTGIIVLVMQRLHNDDLTNHLQESGDWEVLKIPAIADKNYYYTAKNKYSFNAGELLNENRDSKKYIEKLQLEVNAKTFAAQYMQNPVKDNYNILKMEDIVFYDALPDKFDYHCLSFDTAIKVSDSSDFSVVTCWGVAREKIYLVHMQRQKLAYPELKIMAKKMIKRYLPKITIIEDKASGQALIQDLKNENVVGIVPYIPKIDKITRFSYVVPLFQTGDVRLPIRASYRTKLLEELTNFPATKHDDIVDSVSAMLNYFKDRKPQNIPRLRTLDF